MVKGVGSSHHAALHKGAPQPSGKSVWRLLRDEHRAAMRNPFQRYWKTGAGAALRIPYKRGKAIAP